MNKAWMLIAMAGHRIVSRHETAEEASAAKDAFGGGASNVMDANSDWAGFNSLDLAAVFSALPGNQPTKRFETRAIGLERLKRALEALGDGVPTYDAVPSPSNFDLSNNQQETTTMATKKKIARKPRVKTNGHIDPTVKVTTTGKKEDLRFNTGSARGKVMEAIRRADGEIQLSELVKRCAHFANKALVKGCVEKLRAKGYVTV